MTLFHTKFHSCSVKEQLIIVSVFRQNASECPPVHLSYWLCAEGNSTSSSQSDGERWDVVRQRLSPSISSATAGNETLQAASENDVGQIHTQRHT